MRGPHQRRRSPCSHRPRQTAPRAEEPSTGRHLAGPDRLRNGRVRQFFQFSQHPAHPLFRGEPCERAAQDLDGNMRFGYSCRRCLVLRCGRLRYRVQAVEHAAGAQQVQAPMHDDPVYPGPEGGVTPEFGILRQAVTKDFWTASSAWLRLPSMRVAKPSMAEPCRHTSASKASAFPCPHSRSSSLWGRPSAFSSVVTRFPGTYRLHSTCANTYRIADRAEDYREARNEMGATTSKQLTARTGRSACTHPSIPEEFAMTTQQLSKAKTTGHSTGANTGQGTTTVSGGATGADEPEATRGKTSIADVVVVKIAGIAARETPGVHDMGGGLSRTLGAVRDRVPGGRPNVGRGVKVEVGEHQTAVDLDLIVEYGVPITDVASGVRENVISAVERITGLEVVEVNVAINDVHLPEDDDTDSSAEERVA